MTGGKQQARNLQGFLSLLFPRRCPGCRVLAAAGLCEECRTRVPWLLVNYCRRCGAAVAPSLVLPLCLRCREHPRWTGLTAARSAARFAFPVDASVKALKYGRQLYLSPLLASWLLHAWRHFARAEQASDGLPTFPETVDLLVPVPLHFSRKAARLFNQAELLAKDLSRLSGVPVAAALKRVRATISQAQLGAKERRANVEGAFVAALSGEAPLRGKCILLIDDVMTTGATLDACAKALKKAGPKAIYALTVARD